MTTPGHIGRLVTVLMAAAVCLRLADSVPRLLTGLPRGVVSVATLDELQRRTGVDMPIPLFIPATVEWPPREITIHRGREIAVTARQRGTSLPWLSVATGSADRIEWVSASLPDVTLLQASETTVAGAQARIARVQDRSGVIWHQATWEHAGRTLLVRYRGGLEELLRIAGGLRARSAP